MGRRALNLIVDTNVLLRAAIHDDKDQSSAAVAAMEAATRVVVTTTSLCEFVWVLERLYKRPSRDITDSIRNILNAGNVTADRLAIEFGLLFMDAGSDFADGVIAYEGQRMGGQVFFSFDKLARRTAANNGMPASAP